MFFAIRRRLNLVSSPVRLPSSRRRGREVSSSRESSLTHAFIRPNYVGETTRIGNSIVLPLLDAGRNSARLLPRFRVWRRPHLYRRE